MGEPERRRRRLRPPSAATADAADAAVIETAAVADLDEAVPVRPARRPPSGTTYVDERDVERGLRGLVGSGSSQVSVGAALRARDAARPTDAHLAEAERSLPIVRRNWSPPS
jgi:hypothetical protein